MAIGGEAPNSITPEGLLMTVMVTEYKARLGKYKEKIEEVATRHLGLYVYALIDPRDRKMFYVGKGSGSRLLDHFDDTLRELENDELLSLKTRRIAEILCSGEDVEWRILSRNMESDMAAEICEAAVIAGLECSLNGQLLNVQGGKHGNSHGMVTSSELVSLSAAPVHPNNSVSVLLFPIQKALDAGLSEVDAVSSAWRASSEIRDREDLFAVGLSGGIGRIARKIIGWEPFDEQKWRMVLDDDEHDELLGHRFTAITSAASGFWQYGNYLGVNFDGQGKFQIFRGKPENEFMELG